MFDCRTNRTPIERLGSIGAWFGFVRLTKPGVNKCIDLQMRAEKVGNLRRANFK